MSLLEMENTMPLAQGRRKLLLVAIAVAIVIFVIAFLIGFFSAPDKTTTVVSQNECAATTPLPTTNPTGFKERLVNSLRADHLEDFLRIMTKRPHMGGEMENGKLGEYTRELWKSYGFDNVEMPRYDVLLSIPPKDNPNAVKIIDNTTGEALVTVQGPEKIAEPSENDTLVAPPFLAYSPPGNVTGDLLYVNYGSTQDFETLRGLGITCHGKIVMMRYGKLFRGDKVKHAEQCGAIGVLIYSDPADYVPAGVNKTFPDSWWLPSTGAQRGTIYANNGDPLTPDLPATDGIYRIPFNKTKGIPRIPAQPMTYGDAVKFLSRMGGMDVPSGWSGRLNITYKLGPGFRDSNLKVRLEVNNEFVTRSTYNVIGTIRGAVEPDRVVLVGNHRDAWVFGGVDPSSGSAVMMEVTRGLGKLLTETDWRPRRTIMFCSWGAEEYGLIGSVEWVEENQKTLGDRAVTYINLDSAVSGNFSFKANGSPLLANFMFEETAKVTDQNKGTSIFDSWAKLYPSSKTPGRPYFGGLGSGSDYTHFAHFLGVPSLDMQYTFNSHNIRGYPVYHSVHDTFYWQKTFNDPNFKSHLTMAQVTAQVLMGMADTPMIPFEFGYYNYSLVHGFRGLKTQYGERLERENITLDFIEQAISNLAHAANKFATAKQEASGSVNFAKLRMLNDQMMLFERSFIWPYGLPGRPDTRHVIFAPQLSNAYGSDTFPAIVDAMYDIDQTGDWDLVKKQISIVTHSLRAAAASLASI